MGDSDGSHSCKDISQEHPSEEHDDPGSLEGNSDRLLNRFY